MRRVQSKGFPLARGDAMSDELSMEMLDEFEASILNGTAFRQDVTLKMLCRAARRGIEAQACQRGFSMCQLGRHAPPPTGEAAEPEGPGIIETIMEGFGDPEKDWPLVRMGVERAVEFFLRRGVPAAQPERQCNHAWQHIPEPAFLCPKCWSIRMEGNTISSPAAPTLQEKMMPDDLVARLRSYPEPEDGMEAADRITALSAEVERLKTSVLKRDIAANNSLATKDAEIARLRTFIILCRDDSFDNYAELQTAAAALTPPVAEGDKHLRVALQGTLSAMEIIRLQVSGEGGSDLTDKQIAILINKTITEAKTALITKES